MRTSCNRYLGILAVFSFLTWAGPAPARAAEPAVSADSSFLVLIPERIDVEWYWYFYTAETQHFVQSAVEKKLLRAGYDVVDVSAADAFKTEQDVAGLAAPKTAVALGRAVGAAYVIAGQATAVRASHDVAYGVDVYRAAADATAKLIRVRDGKVLAVEEAESTEGGQAQRTAGRDALKSVGKKLADRILAAVNRMEHE